MPSFARIALAGAVGFQLVSESQHERVIFVRPRYHNALLHGILLGNIVIVPIRVCHPLWQTLQWLYKHADSIFAKFWPLHNNTHIRLYKCLFLNNSTHMK